MTKVATVLPADTQLAEDVVGVCELAVPGWSPQRGSFSYKIPSPKIEVRKATYGGKVLVALINRKRLNFDRLDGCKVTRCVMPAPVRPATWPG